VFQCSIVVCMDVIASARSIYCLIVLNQIVKLAGNKIDEFCIMP
jgi:hypothetical protein